MTCGKWQVTETTRALGFWAWQVGVNDEDEKWVLGGRGRPVGYLLQVMGI